MFRILQQFILTTLLALFASQASAMFIQPDWLHPTQPGVGTNRYAYAGNDPVNLFDPSGNQYIDSQTNEYLTEDEYNRAANDANSEIERLQNEWDNNPQRGDAAYGYDIEQLRRQAETYQYYAGAVDQERIDHFRQGLVAPAAGALTLGVGTPQAAATRMPRMSPVVGGVPKSTLPATTPRSTARRGNPNQVPASGTVHVDSRGNAISTPQGGYITGSPNGRYIQARDANGVPTGVRIDGPHSPRTHTDPRSLSPHGHVPGVANQDGTPWLSIR